MSGFRCLSTLGVWGLFPGGCQASWWGVWPCRSPLLLALGKDWGQEGSDQGRKPHSQGLSFLGLHQIVCRGLRPLGLAMEGVSGWTPADPSSHPGTSPANGWGGGQQS